MDIWDYHNEHWDDDRASFSVRMRGLLAICDLRQEVNSDGFEGYLSYSWGNTAPDALAALPETLGTEWAAILREAMSLVGDPYPLDPNARAALLDAGGPDTRGVLSKLDERFDELEGTTEADAILTACME